MFNKIYDFIKKIIKSFYKEIIFLIFFFILVNFPLNYYIIVGGGTINIDDKVTITEQYDSKGTLNLAYVTEVRGTIPSYLISYVIKDWERIPISDYKINDNESINDISIRNRLYLEQSQQVAIDLAYTAANKDFEINKSVFNIVYLDPSVEEDLKIGDKVLKIDGNVLYSMTQYKEIINSKEIGEYVTLLIDRDNKQKEVKIKVKKINDEKLTGIAVLELYDYNVDPSIKFSFDKSESGPSGGLMLTLAIYNKLTNEDITKGLNIVGTGTIDSLGNVGQIDGVKYKLMGAVKKKADIFIAPKGSNYEECIELKKEKGYDIQIIEADTFETVLQKLKEI